MGVLRGRMPMYHMHAVSAEARRGCQIHWNWNHIWLLAALLVPGSLEEYSVLLTVEPFLQPPRKIVFINLPSNIIELALSMFSKIV